MLRTPRTVAVGVAALGALALVVACGSSARPKPSASSSTVTAPTTAPLTTTPLTTTAPTTAATTTAATSPARTLSPTATTKPPSAPATAAPTTPAQLVPAGTGPVIVIDPGHSPTIHSIDPATGLNDSDYENEPEMQDVFAVALLVRAQLRSAGYRVVLTKTSADQRLSLGQRAAIANNAHAALAISIHDQAGPNGGIAFSQGNNIVYYQSVGDYRETPAGKKVVFTNRTVAAVSQRYGAIFQTQRAAAEGHSVRLQGNVGYDLGSRGLAPGNIWIVQLLSTVPWIYNEAGGNSPGRSGLDATDRQRYANGLVAGIEHSVPVTR